jgi:hypothetical protein
MRSLTLALAAAAVLSAQNPPSAAEQETILAQAAAHALRYDGQIPDFLCRMSIVREEASAGSPPKWKLKDKLEEQIGYVDRRPVVTLISVNGKATRKTHRKIGGVTSDGVLGAGIVPKHVFYSKLGPQFTWRGWDSIGDRRVRVFAFDVAPFLAINAHGKHSVVGFRGLAYLDSDTQRVVRLHQEMYSNTAGYPFADYVTEFDYAAVTIGDQEHYLPVRASEYIRRGNNLFRNAIEFSGYRKYSADAVVSFQ